MVEVEAVHLRADDVVVHLLRDGPGLRVDRGQAALVAGQLAALRGHGGGPVIRHAVHELRPLERPPFAEQRDEVVVSSAHVRRGAREQAGDEDRGSARGQGHREDGM